MWCSELEEEGFARVDGTKLTVTVGLPKVDLVYLRAR
jgi:hypothetical protein